MSPLEFAPALSTDRMDRGEVHERREHSAFGQYYAEHMSVATYTAGEGWGDAKVVPFAPMPLLPSAGTLHYGQEIFEGMKAYRHDDGGIYAFRPEMNAARFRRSAWRMAMAELPEDDYLAGCRALIEADHEWVPAGEGRTLYLRPFMFGSEGYLGVRPSAEYTFAVIASPVGEYFAKGVAGISLWVTKTFSRAALGGTGAAKCGGNYAASMAAAREAAEHGCDQTVFLDAAEHRYIEELGGMNMFFVRKDGSLITPELTGTILEGVTRDSIIQLARHEGREVVERKIDIAEWQDCLQTGDIVEAFACGTAAIIAPVGQIVWDGGEVTMPHNEAHLDKTSVAMQIRQKLMDIQFGRAEDPFGWVQRWL